MERRLLGVYFGLAILLALWLVTEALTRFGVIAKAAEPNGTNGIMRLAILRGEVTVGDVGHRNVQVAPPPGSVCTNKVLETSMFYACRYPMPVPALLCRYHTLGLGGSRIVAFPSSPGTPGARSRCPLLAWVY